MAVRPELLVAGPDEYPCALMVNTKDRGWVEMVDRRTYERMQTLLTEACDEWATEYKKLKETR